MALIKCIDCGKEISNRSKACIFCGCPVEIEVESNNKLYNILSVDYNDNKRAELFLLTRSMQSWYGIPKEELREAIVSKEGNILISGVRECHLEYLLDQFKFFNCNVQVEESDCAENAAVNNKISEWKKEKEEAQKPPMCPKCGSPHIVTGQRGHSILTGFWGSNKTVNRCSKCGYSWEPRK